MDADLEVSGGRTTFKEVLEPRILLPQIRKEQSVTATLLPQPADEVAQTLSSQSPSYSLILFGPPGTAKTTTCTSMANYLGWNFLTIDTACFLANGLENVASRMTYIFERLNALEKTIILFDEVEEFCLDRESPGLAMESRMLTTAMLTQLNELRRKQASIFIVATNRLRSFDAAVTRPGRFDMLIFLGTPNLASRVQRLRAKCASPRISPADQALLVRTVEEFMDSRWDSIRYMTFAENEAFLNAAIDLVAAGELSRETLVVKLQGIARTATIQGAVKEDYLLSESMSRV
jgi:SpoVK/Ycf46/Vps4 family AAA+-type ATPase